MGLKKIIAVTKGKDPYETTMEALSRISLPPLKDKRILLKPNAARLMEPEQGGVTHPAVVAAVIDHLRDRGGRDIYIGESPILGVKVKEVFDLTGMARIAGERGIPLIDFDKEGPLNLPVPKGLVVQTLKVAAEISRTDYIVSIPVMKTHMHTTVTLSIKNMKGVLWRREKVRLHQLHAPRQVVGNDKELDVAISDLASVLLPDLAVIDGNIGMEGLGPGIGNPRNAGLVVVSQDPVAADAVASRLMGFSPQDIPHLRLISERGMGEIDLSKLRIDPDNYLALQERFEPPPEKISFEYPGVEVHDEESCSACLSTVFLFLKRYYEELEQYLNENKKLNLAIGKGVINCPEGTVYVGNCSCSLENAKGSLKVAGCPPVGSQIWESINLK